MRLRKPTATLWLICIAGVTLVPAARAPGQAPPPAKQDAPPATKKDLPPAKEVLSRSMEAMGGQAALDKITSSRIKATMSSPMGNRETELFWMKSGKALMKMRVSGMEVTQGFDGKIGWGLNPMMGGYQLMPTEQASALQDETSLHLLLTRMSKRFGRIETIDLRAFDGRDCYVLLLAEPKDEAERETTAYFDAATRLPAGLESTMDTPAGPQPVTQKIRKWTDANGLKVIQKMVLESPQQPEIAVEITEVEFNKVDPSVFEAPPEVKQMAAEREQADKEADDEPAKGPDKAPGEER